MPLPVVLADALPVGEYVVQIWRGDAVVASERAAIEWRRTTRVALVVESRE